MKRKPKVDICGKIKNVNIQRFDSTRRVKLCIETEDLHEGIKLLLPVAVWENKINSSLDLLTIGTNVHVLGTVRVKNLTTAYRMEKTVRDLIASQVDIIKAN